jgi:tetratricopeptide (TPR) repeat protein
MNSKEWFRGTEWDKESQNLFEDKLKKSRGSYNKSQYLLIKAGYLLGSKDFFKESEGCRLLERLVNEYSNEVSHVMFAYEQLGDYYFSNGEYEKAEFNYRQSISFYKQNGRSGSSGIGDIKLAETLFNANKSDKFSEAYYLLTDEFKRTGGELILNDDKFRYYSVLAKIAIALKKKEEARQYALKALQIATIKESQLDNYPQLGVVKVSNDELAQLKNISGENIFE